MKEFIEKLIKKLYESVKRKSCPDEACWEHLNKNCDYCDFKEIKVQDAIEIVNQLAEEYRQDLDKNSQGWIPCSSGTMPNENETIMLTFKNSAGLHVGEATYKNKMFFYVTDTEFGYYEEVYKNPIAWKPKDAPYQLKGE